MPKRQHNLQLSCICRSTSSLRRRTQRGGPTSFDDLLKKSDKDGNGILSGAEFGEGELGRVLTAFGSMAGTRDGIVDREEWAEVWRWVGKPALTPSV